MQDKLFKKYLSKGKQGLEHTTHATHATHAAHTAHTAHASGAAADFFSGFSTTMASVVKTKPAMEAAFCKAERTTLAGSIIPAAIKSSNSPVAAL